MSFLNSRVIISMILTITRFFLSIVLIFGEKHYDCK